MKQNISPLIQTSATHTFLVTQVYCNRGRTCEISEKHVYSYHEEQVQHAESSARVFKTGRWCILVMRDIIMIFYIFDAANKNMIRILAKITTCLSCWSTGCIGRRIARNRWSGGMGQCWMSVSSALTYGHSVCSSRACTVRDIAIRPHIHTPNPRSMR